MKEAAKQDKKISITLSIMPSIQILDQIRLNPMIENIDCVNLSASDQGRVLEAVSNNQAITGLSLKNVGLSIDSKNLISMIVRNRCLKKFRLENCQLCDWDIQWLQDILKNLQGVEALALVDNFSAEHYNILLHDYPMVNLRMLGINVDHLPDVKVKLQQKNLVCALEVTHASQMTREHIEDVFGLVSLRNITQLSLPDFKPADEYAYKKLIASLSQSDFLECLRIQYCPGMENDIFALLTMHNSRLESVSLEGSQRADKNKLERIETLTHRNQLIQAARKFLGEGFTDTLDEQAKESLAAQAQTHVHELQNVSDLTYISSCQDEIKLLIQGLQDFHSTLHRHLPAHSLARTQVKNHSFSKFLRHFN
jgi:hypothetical protein